MRVLAIAVHPDDETLGAGGTLLKHRLAGDSIHWLVVTSAAAPFFTDERAGLRDAQVRDVAAAYPFDSLDRLNLPAARLDTMPLHEIVASIRDVIARIRPEIVFVPNRSDAHSDHRVVSRATQAVVKSFYMSQLGVRRVLACEVPSETDAADPLPEQAFLPQVLVDVSATLERKLDIMRLYGTEVHAEPLPRSMSAIRALARVRGAAIGVEYAEAFMLIREIA